MKRTSNELDEAPEWTEETFAHAQKAMDIPEIAAIARKGRGPQKKPTKRATTIRLSPEVLDFFQAQGDGWQGRIDNALKEYVKEHRKRAPGSAEPLPLGFKAPKPEPCAVVKEADEDFQKR
ncbi:BrnA antitoxin family protein [Geomesophilobacter sediminis]|uniref:BrnA antitoxin family protein n=1 Tax=Geomesophilobacter sediminis TaxID=2798584 RepID=A0A8J7M258_9BACT|nr:BrnA antitoxin family protein [Geomesophilobacter sediminis]MBJ6727343.1 BrnA antitoxin family protein [Geomesophilobacter sediminis]